MECCWSGSARLTLAGGGADLSVLRIGSIICASIIVEGSNCHSNSTGCERENGKVPVLKEKSIRSDSGGVRSSESMCSSRCFQTSGLINLASRLGRPLPGDLFRIPMGVLSLPGVLMLPNRFACVATQADALDTRALLADTREEEPRCHVRRPPLTGWELRRRRTGPSSRHPRYRCRCGGL